MKSFFLIIGFILLLACKGPDEMPTGIIPESQMVSVLIDVYLLESRVENIKLKRDSAKILYDIGFERTLEKHGISDSLYKGSMGYYIEKPDKLATIFETVLDSLNLKKQQIEPDTTKAEKD